jgi:hypothetical protein
MREEKEITQSQVMALLYLQISMQILWSLMYVGFVCRSFNNWFVIVSAILFVFMFFIYIKKNKKDPLSKYLTIRAIIINAIGLSIMSFLMKII